MKIGRGRPFQVRCEFFNAVFRGGVELVIIRGHADSHGGVDGAEIVIVSEVKGAATSHLTLEPTAEIEATLLSCPETELTKQRSKKIIHSEYVK